MDPAPTPPSARPVAIVTGASSGIGEAAARALGAAGYDVALVARRTDLLELCAKQIEELGARALPVAADLADEEQTLAAVARTHERFGRIDLLVNNAGYSPGMAIEQCSRQQLRHIFDVNLLGALQMIGAVTPIMRAQGGGRIVNVGSLAATVPAPLAVPYAGTKIALHAATDALRLELAPFSIRLSLVIPGFVATEVFDKARETVEHLRADSTNPYQKKMFELEEIADENLKTAISPDDVAKVIVRAATAKRPRAYYWAPFAARLQATFMGLLPARAQDAVLKRVFKVEDRVGL